jgi:hypothetical protein
LKKNTEEIGSLFDPQPSGYKGNIRCVSDPTEMVLGYISSGSITQKRFYIHPSKIPYLGNHWENNVDGDVRGYTADNIGFLTAAGYLIVKAGEIASGYCIDCRLLGSNVKPDYWP